MSILSSIRKRFIKVSVLEYEEGQLKIKRDCLDDYVDILNHMEECITEEQLESTKNMAYNFINKFQFEYKLHTGLLNKYYKKRHFLRNQI